MRHLKSLEGAGTNKKRHLVGKFSGMHQNGLVGIFHDDDDDDGGDDDDDDVNKIQNDMLHLHQISLRKSWTQESGYVNMWTTDVVDQPSFA